MPGSFSAGLSGLNANNTYLSVIGNNLANINTVGFKSSSVTFMDLVSQTMGGTSANPMQVGLGVTTGSISPVFSQGAIENTREATNVAIQGDGFFVVRDLRRQRVHARRQLHLQQRRQARDPGRRVRAGLHDAQRDDRRRRHHWRAGRHHGAARRAARAGRDDEHRHADQPECRRRHGRHAHRGRADLRLARQAARRDDPLHEDRGRRSVELRSDRAVHGSDGNGGHDGRHGADRRDRHGGVQRRSAR